MGENRFISYIRVSTAEQGESGLGLEAQRHAVKRYVESISATVIEEFVEIESGAKNDRSQLKAALDSCKHPKATLVIAKLDRLARNVAFISALMESGVSFVAVDNPHANKLMIHMLAAFAEHERDQISSRTKAALAAAKARGVVLGKYGKEVLAKRNREAALGRARDLTGVVREMSARGMTIQGMSDEMNRRGIPTARGGKWHPATTHQLLKRVQRLNA
jgi:DNA invertase Pin-like site-specific DNA recombinase